LCADLDLQLVEVLERLSQLSLELLGGHRPRFPGLACRVAARRAPRRIAKGPRQTVALLLAEPSPRLAHRIDQRSVEPLALAVPLERVEACTKPRGELRHRLCELAGERGLLRAVPKQRLALEEGRLELRVPRLAGGARGVLEGLPRPLAIARLAS
jgi:hypothetical protein